MPAPKNAAEREVLTTQAYELTLRGLSYRELGRQLNIDKKTASKYVNAEAARRREMRPDPTQMQLDSYWYIIRRIREELEQKDPSPHAVSQLAHAMNSALNSIDLIHDTRAPSRSQQHINIDVGMRGGFENLTYAQLTVLDMLLKKTQGEVAPAVDLMPEIVQRYSAGTLAEKGPDCDVLEIEAAAVDGDPHPPEDW